MNIITQIIEKEIKEMLREETTSSENKTVCKIDDYYKGKYCIIRTYSAGVFFGKIKEKENDEVIVNECRRLYFWKTNGGISLSEVAISGLHDDSKVCKETNNHYVKSIELIECSNEAIENIRAKKDYVN